MSWVDSVGDAKITAGFFQSDFDLLRSAEIGTWISRSKIFLDFLRNLIYYKWFIFKKSHFCNKSVQTWRTNFFLRRLSNEPFLSTIAFGGPSFCVSFSPLFSRICGFWNSEIRDPYCAFGFRFQNCRNIRYTKNFQNKKWKISDFNAYQYATIQRRTRYPLFCDGRHIL